MTFFGAGVPLLFTPSSRVHLLHLYRHEILSQETKDRTLLYGENPESLFYQLNSNQLPGFGRQTVGSTYGRTDTKTELP